MNRNSRINLEKIAAFDLLQKSYKLNLELMDLGSNAESIMEVANESIIEIIESNDEDEFEIGEIVLYQNGTRFELGVIKSFNSQGKPFVLYHTGDTAACTSLMHLHKIANNYAFIVERLNCNAPMNEIIDRKEKVLNINLRK